MNKAFLVGVSQLGVKGTLGSSHNPQILKYFRDIGHEWVKDDETAWCAAYINWCLLRAGLPHTGKLNARSFLKYGDETTKPVLGDLAVGVRPRWLLLSRAEKLYFSTRGQSVKQRHGFSIS
jgi:uncharacterized protein (TIGR02594 family)